LVSDIAQAPIDQNKTTGQRLLLAVVIFLGVLIVIAVVVLVVGLFTRLGPHAAPVAADPLPGAFVLPPGSRIVSEDVTPGRLVLRVANRDGEEIYIIDTEDGHLIERVMAPVR
jgi:hypothetical protein